MDQMEGAGAQPQECLELALVRRKRLGSLVEPAREASAHQSLDLRAMMVCRHEHLVVADEAEGAQAMPEPMAGALEQHAPRLVQRKRDPIRGRPRVDAERERGHNPEPRDHYVPRQARARLASGRPNAKARPRRQSMTPGNEGAKAWSSLRSRSMSVHLSFHGSSPPRNS